MNEDHNPKPDPEDRRKHLDYVQSVITRMSAASSAAKGWLLPVVTATYGYALTQHADSVAVLGMASVLVFGLLDANYLNQERAFRALYDRIVADEEVPRFSLDPSLAAPAQEVSGRNPALVGWRIVTGWFPPPAVLSSWAVAPFYGSFLAVGAIIVWRVH